MLKERVDKLFMRGLRRSAVTPNSQNSKPDCEPHVVDCEPHITLLKYSTLHFLSKLPVYLYSIWYIVPAYAHRH